MHSVNNFELSRAAAVHDLRERGVSDFWDVCRQARGADPIFVARELGQFPAGEEATGDRRQPGPDESPGRAEWYFSARTSAQIDELLPGKLLCLGVPTLATVRQTGALLVDDSPWLAERFNFRGNKWERSDVAEVNLDGEFQSAILDPPWYGDNLLDWLHFASAHVSVGGLLAVPLMGENTRPSARLDRERIMGAASLIGALELHRDLIRYEVPSFERHALFNAGFGSVEPWRHADLLLVRNDFPTQGPRLPVGTSDWFDVRVGRQIVSIRKAAKFNVSSSRVPFVTPVAGYGDYLLASVSRRDPKLESASFWTSKGTVGAVRDCVRFMEFLDLCTGASVGVRGLEGVEAELASEIGLDLVLEDC